jgi:hypothetical protein
MVFLSPKQILGYAIITVAEFIILFSISSLLTCFIADRFTLLKEEIWRVAANILNKQPRTAEKGLGVGRGLTITDPKSQHVTK